MPTSTGPQITVTNYNLFSTISKYDQIKTVEYSPSGQDSVAETRYATQSFSRYVQKEMERFCLAIIVPSLTVYVETSHTRLWDVCTLLSLVLKLN